MTNTNLIIAIVFASLFGFFNICFAMWCVGCYMHRHCLDLGQYFNAWSLPPAQPTSVVCIEKHCSRDEKSVRGRRPERLQIQSEYEYGDCEQGRIWNGNGDTRPMVRHPIQAHHEPHGQPYHHPSLKQKNRVQNMQPRMQQQIPMDWQAQNALHASPFGMLPEPLKQPSRHTVPRTSKPDQGLARYQPQGLFPHHQRHEESVGPEACGADQRKSFLTRDGSTVKHTSQARRVDYIHVCDEYPPIVLEALEKAAPAPPTASSSASSSSSSSGSGTTQEIPRTSIGRATPDYVTSSPIQFPRYCHFDTVAGDLSR